MSSVSIQSVSRTFEGRKGQRTQALLNTGQIIFGIIVIGLIGLVSDFIFKTINRRMFEWSTL